MYDEVTKCLGLITQYNPLELQPGALVTAKDCVVMRENVIENRRGYAEYFSSLSAAPSKFMKYLNKIITHAGTTIYYDNSGTPVAYTGSYSAPSGEKIRHVESLSNLYFTTSEGVKKFTNIIGTEAVLTGVPRCLDPSYTLNAAGSGFLTASYQCAYRFTIERTDANGNISEGYPSNRLVTLNSAVTAKNNDITLYLPTDAILDDVILAYRTVQVSGISSDTSGDEMGLVYRYTLTAGDIVNGYITFTDSVIDDLRGANLYTNPSQQGIAQANERPPLCKDIALYRDFMFYVNIKTRQRFNFTMVGVSNLSGNVLTLAGTDFTFGAAENTATGTVQVFTSGTDAEDIDNTARSLVRVINRYSANTSVYAYYQSGYDDLPGKILIESRTLGTSAFTAQINNTSAGTDFFPNLPLSPAITDASTSSNDTLENYFAYSKTSEHESVPVGNREPVGSSIPIRRVIALKDAVIFVKDDGVYRLTGEDPTSFVVTKLDDTVRVAAIDSVAKLANTVVMLSNQGVVGISETGVEVLSRDIENVLKKLLTFSNLNLYTTGFAYESDRMYFLSTMTGSTDTAPQITWVYNLFTRTWTQWRFGISSALVEDSVDKLFFSKPGISKVFRERKDYKQSDYADPESDITITSIVGLTVVFTWGSTAPKEGDAIKQNDSSIPIDSVTINGHTATAVMLAEEIPSVWTTGAAELFPGVNMEVEWTSWVGGAKGAGLMKQVSEIAILSDNTPGENSATKITPTFRSNFDADKEEVDLAIEGNRWGDAWGTIPWGGGGDPFGYRTFVPRDKSWCTRLNVGFKHKNGLEKLVVTGCAYNFSFGSERLP